MVGVNAADSKPAEQKRQSIIVTSMFVFTTTPRDRILNSMTNNAAAEIGPSACTIQRT